MHSAAYVQQPKTATSKFLSAKALYLMLATAGTIVPWTLLLQFFYQNGLSINLFFQNAFSNNISCDLAADLLISALVFFCFSLFELKRLGLSRRWLSLYVVVTFGIGLSCALPLFFYFREQALETLKLEGIKS